MTPMKAWMEKATKDEQLALAKAAKTSRAYLYQLATGHRQCGPELARSLEAAALKLKEVNPKLPELTRAKLCPKIWG
jgi:hypothetical protein